MVPHFPGLPTLLLCFQRSSTAGCLMSSPHLLPRTVAVSSPSTRETCIFPRCSRQTWEVTSVWWRILWLTRVFWVHRHLSRWKLMVRPACICSISCSDKQLTKKKIYFYRSWNVGRLRILQYKSHLHAKLRWDLKVFIWKNRIIYAGLTDWIILLCIQRIHEIYSQINLENIFVFPNSQLRSTHSLNRLWVMICW